MKHRADAPPLAASVGIIPREIERIRAKAPVREVVGDNGGGQHVDLDEFAERARRKRKERYEKNREEILERKRERYANDPKYRDNVIKAVRKYREERAEEIRARARNHRKEHPELKEKVKEYYQSHREQRLAYAKAYRADPQHAAKAHEYARNYRKEHPELKEKDKKRYKGRRREENIARSAKFRAEHPDVIRERKRTWCRTRRQLKPPYGLATKARPVILPELRELAITRMQRFVIEQRLAGLTFRQIASLKRTTIPNVHHLEASARKRMSADQLTAYASALRMISPEALHNVPGLLDGRRFVKGRWRVRSNAAFDLAFGPTRAGKARSESERVRLRNELYGAHMAAGQTPERDGNAFLWDEEVCLDEGRKRSEQGSVSREVRHASVPPVATDSKNTPESPESAESGKKKRRGRPKGPSEGVDPDWDARVSEVVARTKSRAETARIFNTTVEAIYLASERHRKRGGGK